MRWGLVRMPILSADQKGLLGWHGPFRGHLTIGAVAVVMGLAFLGLWFLSRVNHSIETEAGQRAGRFLETTLAGYADDLAGGSLPATVQAQLDAHFDQVSRSIGVFDMIVWTPGGRVLYAARPGMRGETFPVGRQMQQALGGRLSVAIDDRLHLGDPAGPTAARGTFFEIYVPIRAGADNRIIAVAEYYQDAAAASRVLSDARWEMGAAVVATGVALMLALYWVLRQADAALIRQRRDLGHRLENLIRQQRQQELRLRDLNSDIHDGIGQLLTVALLRMKSSPAGEPADADARAVCTILEEAMDEVRMLLTETREGRPSDLPLVQAVRAVVADHMRRTGTAVDLVLDPGLPEPAHEIRDAICRVLREGLHNAFKHAGGRAQAVTVRRAGGGLVLRVSDAGGSPTTSVEVAPGQSLGLFNMRRRVESLGGRLRLIRRPGAGTRLRATFPMGSPEPIDA